MERVIVKLGRQFVGLGALCAALLAPASLVAQATAPAAPPPPYLPAGVTMKYEADIAAFEAADRTAPPAPGGIEFIGSSIFRQWEQLTTQMAPLPVFNRAFGGSRTWEVLHYVDRVVIPYKPAFVVYYCGSNDMNSNQDAAGTIDRIRQFNAKVYAALPTTRIVFVAVQKAPDKRKRWPGVDSVNAALAADAKASKGRLLYVDLNPVLFDAKGEIRGELFKPDSLHFNQPVYEQFTAVIKPVLEKAWRERTK
jgi:lysophospholipase L1-like esterase